MTHFKPALALAMLGLVAACAAPAPVVVQQDIRPQPTFDKFGGGSCEDGYIYIPGTAPMPPECIPEDDCDDVILADGSVAIECPDPDDQRRPDDSSVYDDSPSDDERREEDRRDPTGAPAGAA